MGRHEEAIAELLQAEELFNKLENKRELSGLYKTLGDYFGKLEDYKQAWEYQQKHNESLKYFFNIERENAVTRARKEFETGQKEKEAELLKAKNEEIQLYVRKLESSNNELKRFAHVASHDLREPLRMVNSYMNLLKKSMNGNITETQAEFIAFAIDGSKRMDQLIIDLLSLAKVDRDPKIVKVNMRTVFEEISLNLDALIKENKAIVKIHGHLPEITADRTQILQVFQNLIANGIKYNTSDEPLIEVSCVEKKNTIEISVADNGVGISEEFRGKVFEIFQRLNPVKETKGSGIGLSITKKIVDGMDGKIWIEDNKPQGSVFVISLPGSLVVNPMI
jgi:light-regulated signal transduction histidine kinase (bacteriophytochrome)